MDDHTPDALYADLGPADLHHLVLERCPGSEKGADVPGLYLVGVLPVQEETDIAWHSAWPIKDCGPDLKATWL
jgi:hypothetical protein